MGRLRGGWTPAFAFLLVQTALGLQIISQITPLAPDGTTLLSTAELGFRLQPQDVGTDVILMRLTNAGVMQQLKFSSNPVVYSYLASLGGYVHRDGAYVQDLQFFVRDTGALSTFDPTLVSYDPAGRSLLSTNDEEEDKSDQDDSGGPGPSTSSSRRLLQVITYDPQCHLLPNGQCQYDSSTGAVSTGIDSITCQTDACRDDAAVEFYNGAFNAEHNVNALYFNGTVAMQALCFAFYNNVRDSRYLNCAQGATNLRFQGIQNDAATMASDLRAYQTTLRYYIGNLTQAQGDLLTQTYRQGNATQYLQGLIGGISGSINSTGLLAQSVAQSANKRIADLGTQIALDNTFLAQQAANLTQVAAQTASALVKTYSIVVQNYLSARQQYQAAVDAYAARRTQVFTFLLAVQNLYSSASTTFSDYVSGAQLNRRSAVSLHKRFAEFASKPNKQGELLYPWVDDLQPPATSPSNLGAAFKAIVDGDFVIRFPAPVAGAPYGYAIRMQVQHEANDYDRTAQREPPWQTLFETMEGPQSCDATFTAPNITDRCRCIWKVVDDNYCLLVNTANVVSPEALERFRNASIADELSVNTSCLLPAQAVPGGLTGTIVRTPDQWVQLMGTISRRGNITSDYAYQINSLYWTSRQLTAPWSARVSNFTANLYDLMTIAPPFDDGNLVFSLIKQWQYSHIFAYNNKKPFSDRIYGVIPNDLDQEIIYWRNLTDTSGYGQMFGAMMFPDPSTMLTLTRIEPTATVIDVTVYVNNVSTTVLNLAVDDPMSSNLPSTTYIIWNPTTFQTEFWDTLDRDLLVVGNFRGREFKLTAAAAYERDLADHKYVAYFAGKEPSHLACGHTPAGYRVEREPDSTSVNYGRCTKLAAIPAGGWCDTFDHYLMVPFGQFNNHDTTAFIGFQAREANIIGTIRVADGKVIFLSTSVCPTTRVDVNDTSFSGTGLRYVKVSNPVGNTNSFRVQQVGACPRTVDIELPAFGSTRLERTACPSAPEGSPDVLRFLYLDQATQQYMSCNADIVLNSTHAATGTLDSTATLNFVYKSQTVSSQVLAVAQAESDARIRQAVVWFALQQQDVYISRNLTVPAGGDDPIPALRQLVESIGAGTDDFVQHVANVTNDANNAIQNGTADSLLGQANAAYAASQADIANSQAQFDATLADILANQDALTARVSNLYGLAKLKAETFGLFVNQGIANFLNSFLRLLSEKVADPDRFAAAVAKTAESGMDAGDVEDANTMLNGGVWEAMRIMWRNGALSQYVLTGIVGGIGGIVSITLWRVIFWLVQLGMGNVTRATPCSSRRAYRSDRSVTRLRKLKEQSGGGANVRDAAKVDERRPLF